MQENLIDVFQKLKLILNGYEGPLRPKFDLDSKYDLWSFKDVVIDGRKRKEFYFAGLIIQSKYVGSAAAAQRLDNLGHQGRRSLYTSAPSHSS